MMDSAARHRVAQSELVATLEDVMTRYFGAPQQLKRLRRRVSTYSSSSTVENLEVDLHGKPSLRLVFKNLSPAALLPGARRIRPDFLYEPHREAATYERILRRHQSGTATCYGSVNTDTPERHWLFLERVTGRPLWQVGRMESWLEAARWLARLHGRFDAAEVSKTTECFAHLLQYDERFFRVWFERAETFVRGCRSRTPRAGRQLDRLAKGYKRLINRLEDLPRAFVHGEFYPANIIVSNARDVPRICPVDWELAGIAPGLIDLAALTGGEWSDEDRKKLIGAYRDALPSAKSWPPSLADMLEAVEWCQLHWAVRWLGWASDWSPPDEYTHDWLLEAIRLADKLGL